MKTRDFREIQVSSTLLVIIFLGVLVLGVFIFLLGVSVGKKQVQITAATKTVMPQVQETEKEPEALNPPAADQGQPKAEVPAGETSVFPPPPAAQRQGAPGEKARGGEPGRRPAVKAGEKPSPKGEAKPPSTTPAKQPAVSGAGLYYVQVAAFTDRASAEAEAANFRKRGFTAVVTNPRPTDAKTWYRVRLGGFATRDKAVELLGELNQSSKKKTDYRIVKD
jgi:cell division septation protein DedD